MRLADASDGADCGCGAPGKVLLPFLSEPPVTTYNYAAFLLGALLGSRADNIGFLHNNYIQLSSPSLTSPTHALAFVPALGVDDAPGLGIGQTKVLRPGASAAVEAMVAEALDAKFYARVVLDEFYLPGKPAYQKTHFVHDNLILGYCGACRTCFLAGYRSVATGGASARQVTRFGFSSCALSSLGPAIFSRPDGPDARFLQEEILLFQPGKSPPMDLSFIRAQLEAYLSSTHDPQPYADRGYSRASIKPWPAVKTEPSYGLGIYASLIAFTAASGEAGAKLDLRPFRLLWEHKACMARRLQAVAGRLSPVFAEEIGPKLAVLEESSNAIRRQSMFYRMSPRPDTLAEIVKLLQELRADEASLLGRFLKEL